MIGPAPWVGLSPVHFTRRIMGDMLARRHGKILFTSSIAATMPGGAETNFFRHAAAQTTPGSDCKIHREQTESGSAKD